MVPGLSKATAGRYTEQDAATIENMFRTLGASPQTMSVMRNKLMNLSNEKMNFPMLESIGIKPDDFGRFGGHGQAKFQMGPVKPVGK